MHALVLLARVFKLVCHLPILLSLVLMACAPAPRPASPTHERHGQLIRRDARVCLSLRYGPLETPDTSDQAR